MNTNEKMRELLEGASNFIVDTINIGYVLVNTDLKALKGSIDQAVALLNQEPCATCGGSGAIPERGYIALYGYNDCQGKIYKKEEAITKKGLLHKNWIFKCPVCDIKFAEERLIEWPLIPCPDCTESQELKELITTPYESIEEILPESQETHIVDASLYHLATQEHKEEYEAETKRADAAEKINDVRETEIEDLHDKLKTAEREIERLRKYTAHKIGCEIRYIHESVTNCTCGLDQALGK